ncbi:MAG: methyltransferase domain-containing protein [Bacteroidetes bacterium]|nr:methyltransferase domain-containing protein [Bacteroidota bacterium]
MDKEERIEQFKKAGIEHKSALISSLIDRCDVLDVGCLGQDFDYYSPLWLHARWKEQAISLIGVDVNETELEKFNALKLNYKIVTPNELTELCLNFDRIIMSDVIEHVENVGTFLTFYKKFLKPEGQIIITTPNPFSIKQFFSIMLFKAPSYHPEHTCYIDPINMLEISERSGLEIIDFKWLHFYSKPSKLYQKALNLISRILYRLIRYFSPNYLVILKSLQ